MPSNVLISSNQSATRVPRMQIDRLVAFVAKAEGVRFAQVDIALVDNKEMAAYNRRFLNHSGSTDVISFDLTDEEDTGTNAHGKPTAGVTARKRHPGLSAQLIICGDVAASQGPHHGLSATQELLLYLIHGLLHVIGYDDIDIRAGAKMHALEEELLRRFLAAETKRRKASRRNA